jgi:hypothetical protein
MCFHCFFPALIPCITYHGDEGTAKCFLYFESILPAQGKSLISLRRTEECFVFGFELHDTIIYTDSHVWIVRLYIPGGGVWANKANLQICSRHSASLQLVQCLRKIPKSRTTPTSAHSPVSIMGAAMASTPEQNGACVSKFKASLLHLQIVNICGSDHTTTNHMVLGSAQRSFISTH